MRLQFGLKGLRFQKGSSSGLKGDLYGVVTVAFPKGLDSNQTRLIQELQD